MAQRDKDKARKLIAKLEAHQAAEIRCLRALHGLSSEEDIGVDDKDIDIEEDALSVAANRSAPDSSVQSKDLAESSPDEGPSANSHPLPSQVQCPIPKEWDAEWDNDLLRRRIEERIRDPGCGGDQWKSFPNVDPQDPAAGFINSTALRDLGRFTFKRDLSALEEPGAAGNVLRDDRDSSTAFVVLDFDHNKQLVLDTRRTSPEQQSSSNSKPGEAVGSLFSSV
ncbi:hypothetical protein K440DRAFT_102557 [Wilcoxina mikolae CBS 423.85]|nr:hypothetical protein K440DRAFT_102557 [Wilcoxina mikolae CBS 423.85]